MSRTTPDIERVLGTLLVVGVSAAAAVILLGGVLLLIQNGPSKADFSVFRGSQTGFLGIKEIIAGAVSLRSDGVLRLGVLMLIATPIARVLFSFAAFLLRNDRLYAVITLLVLALIMLGFFA